MKLTHRLIDLMQIPYNKLPKALSDMIWNVFTVSDSKIAVTSRYMYLKKYASLLIEIFMSVNLFV